MANPSRDAGAATIQHEVKAKLFVKTAEDQFARIKLRILPE